MAEFPEQREVPRVPLPDPPAARTCDGLPVRLLDLGLRGARIEHLGLLRPGLPCVLELPAALGFLMLSTKIVWCTVIGAQRSLWGERHLRSQSGLRFGELTEYQYSVLSSILQESSAASSSRVDGRGGAA